MAVPPVVRVEQPTGVLAFEGKISEPQGQLDRLFVLEARTQLDQRQGAAGQGGEPGIYRGLEKFLSGKGVEIARGRCGELLTVQEMGGFQMHLAKLDDQLIELWDAPCDTPYLTVQ